jgi:hypothetical protein
LATEKLNKIAMGKVTIVEKGGNRKEKLID